MMQIPQIKRLTLPKGYPTPEAMKSCNQNVHSYNPDIWELDYVTYRYLSRIAENDLQNRYHEIIRNMHSYTGPERDPIPLDSYQSSWYWFRKEHQTRLEFALRELEPPVLPKLNHVLETFNKSGPTHPDIPDGTKIIFRYGKRKYMRQMVEQGRVRFSPAELYESEENNAARRDDELHKHSYMPGQYTTIRRESGEVTKPIGDIKRTVTGSKYHLVCFSCVWNVELFEDFQADTCVAVSAPEEFAKRLEVASEPVFPGWYFLDMPVQYFDPYEMRKNEIFDSTISKDFRLAYQNEYRILWSQMNASPIDGFQFVEIGPAQDIMTMYDVDGREIPL
ncbi:MAG: hypothetical protein F4X91_05445 [Nitrospinae bacterium]|nr:hypothetical protein [Nitrospinota bacterium]